MGAEARMVFEDVGTQEGSNKLPAAMLPALLWWLMVIDPAMRNVGLFASDLSLISIGGM